MKSTKKQRKEETEKMFRLFQQIWKEREHKSEISGEWLGYEALSIYFHHILPKRRCPEARLDRENIILLTFDEHTNVENNPSLYEKINEMRQKLMEKYGYNKE